MEDSLSDKRKFEKIYLKYYPLLITYGKTIADQEPLIEDTIQELFITLWQKRASFIVRSSFETYLFVAFRNNYIRKLKADKKQDLKVDLEQEELSEFFQEKEEQLLILIEKLPAHQKEVLFLRYYKDKSYQEIAEILGINYQVARNFSYRAIKFLKKNMRHLYSLAFSLLF